MANLMGRAKSLAYQVLQSTGPGYRYLLRRRNGIRRPTRRPKAPWHNAVLRTNAEIAEAIGQVRDIGLPPHEDDPKNWDGLAALDCILGRTNRGARVLDAGAETWSTMLPWLALLGYRNLIGINISFSEPFRRGPIVYEPGDITATRFADGYFDAISCLSVIEHGVDIEKYFSEMRRILKTGGILVTSTDYWVEKVDGQNQEMLGAPVHIFDRSELLALLEVAAHAGFELTSDIDLACEEKAVHWDGVDLDYTFLILAMRKIG